MNATGHEKQSPLALVVELCHQLDVEQISYCHWKSNEAIDRSASGENDLDILVLRRDADRFGCVLRRLGFKQARPEPSREIPGLLDYYGLDEATGRFVHLQAHFQLVLGDDMTKNYRLPVEVRYLESEGEDHLVRLPAPDFELAVFVVRMVLKHATWDAQLCLLGGLSDSEHRELAHLLGQVPASQRAERITDRLPMISPHVLQRCLDDLQSPGSRLQRARTARALERDLAPYARQPHAVDLVKRVTRRFHRVSRRLAGRPARKSLVDGGVLVAVVGPADATVDAVVTELARWLEPAFDVRRHRFTEAADASNGDVALARRQATNGAIVLCAQFPSGRPPPDVEIRLSGPGSDPPLDVIVERARSQIWNEV